MTPNSEVESSSSDTDWMYKEQTRLCRQFADRLFHYLQKNILATIVHRDGDLQVNLWRISRCARISEPV